MFFSLLFSEVSYLFLTLVGLTVVIFPLSLQLGCRSDHVGTWHTRAVL